MDAPLFPQAQTSNVYYCNLIGMVDSTSFDTLSTAPSPLPLVALVDFEKYISPSALIQFGDLP